MAIWKFTCRINDNIVRPNGYDFGNTIYVKYQNGDKHIWHCPGSKVFGGQGRQVTKPSQYFLVIVKHYKDDVYYAEMVEGHEFGHRWKKGLGQLIERIR